jgi:hypothetical protein
MDVIEDALPIHDDIIPAKMGSVFGSACNAVGGLDIQPI